MEHFGEDNWRGKNHRRSACKICTKPYRDRYNANPKNKKSSLKWHRSRYANDPLYRSKIKLGAKRYRVESRANYLLVRARERAKEKGLDFNIDVSDVIVPQYCPLLNIELDKEPQSNVKRHWSSSLDRVDLRYGYVKGNVRVISDLANTMKNAATIEQLLLFAKNIPLYLNQ